jgi:quercetin dioxygenase-like cupin family protein
MPNCDRSTFEPAPVIARAGAGAAVQPFGGETTRVVVPAEATDGAYAVWMHVAQPGFSPPRHVHQREDEIIYVLSGELLMWCDGRSFRARAGDTATMPRGLPHSFRVLGNRPARMLVTVVPGGFERFHAAVVALQLPNDIPDLLDISEEFGIGYVGRPLAA